MRIYRLIVIVPDLDSRDNAGTVEIVIRIATRMPLFGSPNNDRVGIIVSSL